MVVRRTTSHFFSVHIQQGCAIVTSHQGDVVPCIRQWCRASQGVVSIGKPENSGRINEAIPCYAPQVTIWLCVTIDADEALVAGGISGLDPQLQGGVPGAIRRPVQAADGGNQRAIGVVGKVERMRSPWTEPVGLHLDGPHPGAVLRRAFQLIHGEPGLKTNLLSGQHEGWRFRSIGLALAVPQTEVLHRHAERRGG